MFTPAELLTIAMRIEENGQRFYSRTARILEDQTVRLVFNHLADEEVRHQEIFSGLLAEANGFGSDSLENYPGEHLAYINAFGDHLVFGRKLRDDELPEINNARSAIRFGLERESESILFYQEIKELLPKDKRSVVEEIIAEEKRHFTKLAGLIKSYE